MKLLYDFFPVLLFFIAYKWQGIYAATVVAIVAAIIQIGYYWWRHRRFETMHLVSSGLIVVMGGLTIALHDKNFVMWKPTLLNWLFAASFLATSLFSKRTLVERMMGSQIALPAAIWQRLNLSWAIFFIALGGLNLYFVHDYQAAEQALIAAIPNLDTEQLDKLDCSASSFQTHIDLCETAHNKESFWVNFKLFGTLGLTLIFVLIQAFYLARHAKEHTPDTASEDSP